MRSVREKEASIAPTENGNRHKEMPTEIIFMIHLTSITRPKLKISIARCLLYTSDAADEYLFV